MSTRSKARIATFVLLVALSSGVASAAPKRDNNPGSVFGKIGQIVKQIGKIFLPTILDEPSLPKP
jgi:hypothetical protein